MANNKYNNTWYSEDDDDDDYNDEWTFERPKSKWGGDCQMICITPKELMMMMMKKGLSISDIFTTNFLACTDVAEI